MKNRVLALGLLGAALTIGAAANLSAEPTGATTPLARLVLPIEPADHSPLANRSSLLTYAQPLLNNATPAVLLVHDDPGSNATEPGDASRFLAEGLARQGYPVLSINTRLPHFQDRTGIDAVSNDIKGAIDWLAQAGFPGVILGGHGLGAVAAGIYAANAGDRRVLGLIGVAPFPDMPEWMRHSVGTAEYERLCAEAKGLADQAENADHDYLYVRTLRHPTSDVAIYAGFVQNGATWLSWWGPTAGTRLTEIMQRSDVPLLIVAGAHDTVATPDSARAVVTAATGAGKRAELVVIAEADHSFLGHEQQVADAAVKWLAASKLAPRPRVEIAFVDTRVDGMLQPAVMYRPTDRRADASVAFIFLREYHNDMLRRSNHWLAVRMAQAGYTGFSPRVRPQRFNDPTTNEEAMLDIGAWIDAIHARGFRHVVLVGHGLGANRAAEYQALHHDRRVAGIVMLNPGADVPAWTKTLLGEEKFQATVAAAESALASDAGDRMLFASGHMPPPSPPAPWVIETMPAQFLSDWGPKSQVSLTTLLPQIAVPVTLMLGSKSLFLSEQDLTRLAGIAGGPFRPVLYSGAGHGLEGWEDRIATDVQTWIRETVRNSTRHR